ncbi:MAG: phosphodiester glycosidase family protein [Myxococcota bacterium]
MRRLLLLLGTMALGLVLGIYVLPSEGSVELGPTTIDRGKGITVLRGAIFRGARDVGTLVAIYADLSRSEPIIVETQGRPLSEVTPDALAVVNGSFFTPEDRPTGLLVSEGVRLHPFVAKGGAAGSGVLTIEGRQVQLHERAGFKVGRPRFAVQAGPRILEPTGERGIRTDDGLRANRTLIGGSADGRLAMAVVHGREGGHGLGLSLFELQEMLALLAERHPELAWASALNLDGGDSTGLWVSTPRVRLRETVSVPFALALRARSAP